MSKQVVYAQLKETFFIPNMKNGNFGPTLPPANTTLKNFKMFLQDSGDIRMEWEEGGFHQAFTVSQSMIKGCKHVSTPVAPPADAK